MASARLVYILDENTLSRGKLVAIFDRTGVGVNSPSSDFSIRSN